MLKWHVLVFPMLRLSARAFRKRALFFFWGPNSQPLGSGSKESEGPAGYDATLLPTTASAAPHALSLLFVHGYRCAMGCDV